MNSNSESNRNSTDKPQGSPPSNSQNQMASNNPPGNLQWSISSDSQQSRTIRVQWHLSSNSSIESAISQPHELSTSGHSNSAQNVLPNMSFCTSSSSSMVSSTASEIIANSAASFDDSIDRNPIDDSELLQAPFEDLEPAQDFSISNQDIDDEEIDQKDPSLTARISQSSEPVVDILPDSTCPPSTPVKPTSNATCPETPRKIASQPSIDWDRTKRRCLLFGDEDEISDSDNMFAHVTEDDDEVEVVVNESLLGPAPIMGATSPKKKMEQKKSIEVEEEDFEVEEQPDEDVESSDSDSDYEPPVKKKGKKKAAAREPAKKQGRRKKEEGRSKSKVSKSSVTTLTPITNAKSQKPAASHPAESGHGRPKKNAIVAISTAQTISTTVAVASSAEDPIESSEQSIHVEASATIHISDESVVSPRSPQIQWHLPPKRMQSRTNKPKAQLIYMNWMPPPPNGAASYKSEYLAEKSTNILMPNGKTKKQMLSINWTVDPPKNPDPVPQSRAPIHPTQVLKDPIDTFNAIFTDEVFEKIATYTNQFARKEFGENSKTRNFEWKDVDAVEIRAFIGCMLFLGVHQKNRMPTDVVFTTTWYELNLPVILAFARDRFKRLLQCIRFSEVTGHVNYDKMDDPSKDRLIKIREIFDPVIENSRALVEPGHVITVDEAVVSFKGRCPFSQYLPNKPTRYGIKVWCACDTKTGYLVNAQIYSGRTGHSPEQEQGRRVALDLVSPYFGSERVIVTDNFYTSVSLAMELKAKQLDLLGTIREGKGGVPKELYKLQLAPDDTKPAKGKGKKKRPRKDSGSEESEEESDESESESDSESDEETVKTIKPKKSPMKKTKSAPVLPVADISIEADQDDMDGTIGNIMHRAGPVASTSRSQSKGSSSKIFEPRAAFLFTRELTVLKALVKPRRCVYMLSSIHHEPMITSDINAKPDMILFYNWAKVGVDLLDQVVKNYSCKQTTQRWPFRVFCWLVDVAAYNTFVLHRSRDKAANGANESNDRYARRGFLTDLALKLMEPQIRRRCVDNSNQSVQRHVDRIKVAARAAMQLGRDPNGEEVRLLGKADDDEDEDVVPRKGLRPKGRATVGKPKDKKCCAHCRLSQAVDAVAKQKRPSGLLLARKKRRQDEEPSKMMAGDQAQQAMEKNGKELGINVPKKKKSLHMKRKVIPKKKGGKPKKAWESSDDEDWGCTTSQSEDEEVQKPDAGAMENGDGASTSALLS